MKRISHSFLVCLGLLLLNSCGQQADKKEDKPKLGNPNTYAFTDAIRAPETYSEGEMVVAKSVCEAFQQKRAKLSSLGGTVNFNLGISTRNCSTLQPEELRSSASITLDRAGELTLRANNRSAKVLNDVYSDKHVRIQKICESVLSGLSPQNTIQDGALRYQVNFFQEAKYEWVQIVEFSATNGVYYPYLIERGAVITEYASEDRGEIGYVRSRTANRPCPNRQQGQYLTQSIL